jgi:hypothetical protein
MPPLVFDFADIASRLRKDDFYSPQAKEHWPKNEEKAIAYQCRSCDTWFDHDVIVDGAANCPFCGTYNRCYFV